MVVFPRGRGQLLFLRGVMLGISSRQRKPYISRSVWRYLGPSVDLRDSMSDTMRLIGLFPADSGEINPRVWCSLGTQPTDNHFLMDDLAH